MNFTFFAEKFDDDWWWNRLTPPDSPVNAYDSLFAYRVMYLEKIRNRKYELRILTKNAKLHFISHPCICSIQLFGVGYKTLHLTKLIFYLFHIFLFPISCSLYSKVEHFSPNRISFIALDFTYRSNGRYWIKATSSNKSNLVEIPQRSICVLLVDCSVTTKQLAPFILSACNKNANNFPI